MNWKRILLSIAAVALAAAALLGGSFWWVTSDFDRMRYWFGTPSAPFAEQTPPTAPDYTSPEAWARRPEASDVESAAVFFVHPTTYIFGSAWNASLDDPQANGMLEGGVLPAQPAAFDACCDVYVPRYRQAILHFAKAKDDNAKAALDLAYSDVLAAFEAFLGSIGDRPFVIAGHSQGSLHGARLLEQRVSGSPEQERLVAAYLPGYPLPDRVGEIPLCRSATQTGCVVGWQSMEASASAWSDTLVWEGGWTLKDVATVCVNPLNWEVGGTAGAEANLGGNVCDGGFYGPTVAAGLTDARCDGGRLIITPPSQGVYDVLLGEDGTDWHVYDYGLFFTNIEVNAVDRVAAWRSAVANADE